MSNNWKKRVNDFFFDEIEIEVEEEANELHRNPVYRTHPTSSKAVNTKVTYQYPKNSRSSFRFPVIPDNQNSNEKNVVRSEKQRTQKRSKKPQRAPRGNSIKAEYKCQQLGKELENVPAYIRRQKEREQLERKQQPVKEEKKYPEKTKIDQLEGHTRPDELDRVFRIRDGQKPAHSDVKQSNQLTSKIDVNQERKMPQGKTNFPKSEIQPDKRIPISETIVQTNYFDEIDVNEQLNDTQQVEPVKEIEKTPINLILHDDNVLPKEVATEQSELQPNGLIKKVPDYLLNDPAEPNNDDEEWVRRQEYLLNQTLEHFKIDAKVVNVTKGPSVTRFEIQPALGVKVSRIRSLADDIKLNMAAQDIRMEAPIPGKHTIGIEVPNEYPQMVSLQEIIETNAFKQSTSDLTIALGLTLEGDPLITTIDQMPHGLIAGATGSGKSVCINSIILSLLYKSNHEDVKFMMIDPKMVELTPYNGIPNLISPVITDAKAATMALKWAVEEMETRYEKFAEAGVRNLERYNAKMVREQRSEEKMPYIVIIIDELADLMIVSPQDVEDAICRIAQKARACGMHLLVATQRPSVDVITGLIKANIPTRIAFSVSSQVDSRTILDANGAEKLLGKGDMLFIGNGASKSVRLQGPFVSDDEIDRVANYARSIAEPTYLFEQEQLLFEVENEDEDELLQEVITFIVDHHQASTSLLQRRFRIGYNRAARLIDTLEQKGIVSAANGSKPREILVTQSQIDNVF